MAVLDIDGDPVKGVIGGIRDFMVDFQHVTGLKTTSYNQHEFTSHEQGGNYDAAIVSQQETINPDTVGNTVRKVIPWGLIAVGGFVLYIIFRGK
jgi:hypothetical protein